MKILFLSLFIVSCASCIGFAQDKDDIRKVLSAQERAWNDGDLAVFMEGYWNSDSLLFVGKSGPKYGWKDVLENYKKAYPDKAARGVLTFEIKDIQVLTEKNAFVLGEFFLKRQKEELRGYFTLLFRKIGGEWKIVADHSS